MHASIKAIGTGAAGLASFIAIDTHYISAAEFDPFAYEYRQQRIWDMEENVIKADTTKEREIWLERLRELVATFCRNYQDARECKPNYIDSVLEKLE